MHSSEVLVDGVTIGPKTDLIGLFRRQLRGESVFASKTAYGPEDGIARVLGATRGTSMESNVREAIVALLSDADPRVRAGAVMAVGTYPQYFDPLRLMQLLEERPELFRGVEPIAQGYSDLYWEMLEAIVATKSFPPQLLNRLKEGVVDRENGGRLVGTVTRADPGWVLAHAREVTADQPTRAHAVLANLQDPRNRETFVIGLQSESTHFRQRVAAGLGRAVRDPKELERLINLLRG